MSGQPSQATVALFVAGDAPRSTAALRNLSAVLDATGRRSLRVDVFDVLRDPAKALEFGLLATPSLCLIPAAGSRRWYVGDLGRADALADWLADSLGAAEGLTPRISG